MSVGMAPDGMDPDGISPDGVPPSGTKFSGFTSSGGVTGGGGVGGGSTLVITASSGGDDVGATLGSGERPDTGCSDEFLGNVAAETDAGEPCLTQLLGVAFGDETAGMEATANVAGETDVCERRLMKLLDAIPGDEAAGEEASVNMAGETDACERGLTPLLDATPGDKTADVEAAWFSEVVGVALFDLDDGLLASRDNSAATVSSSRAATGGEGVGNAAALSAVLLSALAEGCLPFLRAGFSTLRTCLLLCCAGVGVDEAHCGGGVAFS